MQNQLKISYNVPLYKVDGLTLSVLSTKEVIDQSVSEINKEQTYNEIGDPVPHGINDDLMGTMDKDKLCKTCMGSQVNCPGHFGNLRLAKPVFHNNLLEYIRKVLRLTCFKCSHLLLDNERKVNDIKHALSIKNNKSRFNFVYREGMKEKKCSRCNSENHNYRKETPLAIDYEIMDRNFPKPNNDPKQLLWPEEAKRILDKISDYHLKIMGLNKETSNPANMIIENLAIAPPPVRPSVAMANSFRSEDDLTVAYKQIIQQNNIIIDAIEKGNTDTSIKEMRKKLQFYVATLMDNDLPAAAKQQHKSGKPIKAIRARLKGKEGRVRGNLMGKRVDFSARSVITPDPNLRLDQLGVPREIAKNLTIPEIVTSHNENYLSRLVESGANNYPGAKYIMRSDGKLIDLEVLKNRTDQHLEIGYIVERHLLDDDWVIFNRQPSLHKMSMMGHRVRVLDWQTFRLNLSVTTPYNADFDGDEMNMHVPQSLETKAEIKELMAVPKQIVAPRSNKPCMGIVQDALLGISRLTSRESFITKDTLMDLLLWIDYDLEKGLPTPAIIKPKALWTGKQIISLVIPEVVNLEMLDRDGDRLDSRKDLNVIVQSGELICGVLNKKHVGSDPGGLVHIVWKDLGPQACCDLLSNIQLVVNNWLVGTSFSIGVQDIIAKPEIMVEVYSTIQQYKRKVAKIINIANNGRLKSQPGKNLMESFEAQLNTQLNKARDQAGLIALNALAADNRLKNMVNAGSKGSNLNISQIMACVGQQNVEGKRIPFGFNKRALPHFTKDDFGPESRGFVENCYLTGLTPQEFYFHAMGGREGLIDTAVKTADTGYISRRLMKALEDVMVKYDGTVRSSQEIFIQFLYGEDGMAGEHFEAVPLDLTQMDNKTLNQKCNFFDETEGDYFEFQEKLAEVVGKERADEIRRDKELRELFADQFEQIKADREILRTDIMRTKVESELNMPVNIPRLIQNVKSLNKIKPNAVSDLDPKYYFQEMKKLEDSLCVLPPARVAFSATSIIAEAHKNSTMLFKILLRRLLCAKKVFFEDRLDTQSFDHLISSIGEMFRSAIVHPGEMVGSIGAQSMGEPATQMTLNTFHNAGISSKNVTLGVPRLKEVINVAKTIKTPSLKIFLQPQLQQDQRETNRIANAIQHTNLANLVKEWGVYYDPDPEKTVIAADQELVELFQQVQELHNDEQQLQASRWVLRFQIDSDPMKVLFDENFEFRRDVGQLIESRINQDKEDPFAQIIYSEDYMDEKIIRIRLFHLEDVEEGVIAELRTTANFILDTTLRGFPEITKVFTTCSSKDCVTHFYDKETGKYMLQKKNWVIETDGVALQKVLAVEGVDARRTSSNSIIEVFQVLGVEAARMCLLFELRTILDAYSIYVNYRHLATLVDVMTQRGILTAITRHGINRVNSGPLRKCSFEETTEILLEAAFFGEKDALTGITENIMFGQLASYGTGAFDLVVDREALLNCIENRMGMDYQQFAQSSEYTPMQEVNMVLTPHVSHTPDAFATGGGATSQYTPNPEGGFTPATYRHAFASPGSPGYGMGADSCHASPAYNMLSSTPGGATGQTPLYGFTPLYGKMGTPAYSGGYGDVGAGTQGASQHSSYSPTNLMQPYQSPSYSPTTPNYHTTMGMTPVQQSTPTYQYGGPTPGIPAYQMGAIHPTPSQNPASSMGYGTSPQVSVHSGSGNPSQPFGQSPNMGYGGMAFNPISPSYTSSLPQLPTYDPTRQAVNGLKNQAERASDSSDSEDK